MACLDTSVLLDLVGRGGARVARLARRLLVRLGEEGESLATTRFNVAELWVGVERSKDPRREEAIVEALLADMDILEFDAAAARAFGRVQAHLKTRGRPIGDMDALIASVALVNGELVVTRNPKHFSAIPGLQIEAY